MNRETKVKFGGRVYSVPKHVSEEMLASCKSYPSEVDPVITENRRLKAEVTKLSTTKKKKNVLRRQ